MNKSISKPEMTEDQKKEFLRKRFNEYQNSPRIREYKNRWGRAYFKRPDVRLITNKKIRDIRRKNKVVRLRQNIGRRIRHAMSIRKAQSSPSYLGCTVGEYMRYLESLFSEKMNWRNYGTYWVIDHIKPCALFDLSREEEIKKCFNFKNTQPLTRAMNYKKGDRYKD